jgi:hypothetical protein
MIGSLFIDRKQYYAAASPGKFRTSHARAKPVRQKSPRARSAAHFDAGLAIDVVSFRRRFEQAGAECRK